MLVCVYKTIVEPIRFNNLSSLNYLYLKNKLSNINRIVLYSIRRYIYVKGNSRQMILDLLIWIKSNIDRAMSFRSSCCEGVCGSCAMLINNLNTLACIQPIWLIYSYVIIYPLPHFNIIRDLVVDLKHFYEQYHYINPFYNISDSSGFSDYIYNNNVLYIFYINKLSYLYINNYLMVFNSISNLYNISLVFYILIIDKYISQELLIYSLLKVVCIYKPYFISNL